MLFRDPIKPSEADHSRSATGASTVLLMLQERDAACRRPSRVNICGNYTKAGGDGQVEGGGGANDAI